MDKAIVSFVTRPGRGSEGGVGWAFVSQGAHWALQNNKRLFVVIDARDASQVQAALDGMGPAGAQVALVPVTVPRLLLMHYGDSRSRQTYVGWSFKARIRLAELLALHTIDVVHQVTFATTSLPHILPRPRKDLKVIWGPVTVPSSPTHSRDHAPKLLERLGVWVLQRLGRRRARNIDLIIATNESTQHLLSPVASELEPNIVVDVELSPNLKLDEFSITMSGILVDRKRPWIALQAIQDPRLALYHLNVIGDGRLRLELEELAIELGVSSRVSFHGKLERDEALRIVGSSRVLMHPAIREGSPWVVGEAAALGVPAVVFRGSGADSTVSLSQNGGEIARSDSNDKVAAFVEATVAVLAKPRPSPTARWGSSRIPNLFDKWW